ncbi:ATP-binding protein [Streptomyces sp. TE33382]
MREQRRTVTAFLTHRAVAPQAVDNVVLVVSELLSNAVLYGANDAVGLHLAIDSALGTVLVEVNDHTPGPRADPCLPGDDQESGRGLIFVDRLADAWGMSSDGAVTWCTVRIAAVGAR